MMRRLLLCAVLLPALGGCASWFDGESAYKPTPLKALQTSVGPKLLWQTSVPDGDRGLFTPFVDQGSLWVAGSNGKVQQLDVQNGKTLHTLEVKQVLVSGVAVADGLVFVGNDRGELLAFSAADGKLVWKQPLTSLLAESPQLAGNVLIVRAGDGRVSGFDQKTGRQVWTQWQAQPPLTLRATTPQIKVEGSDVLLVGEAGGKVTAYAAERGEQLWQSVVANARGASELERVTDVVSQPMFDGRRVCAVAYQGRVACFDSRGGQQLWARDLGSSRGLVSDGKAVFVTAEDGAIWAFDADSGRNLWKQDDFRYRNVTAPVKLGDSLLVIDGEGYAHLLSSLDGRIVGRSSLKVNGTLARPLVIGDVAYVLDTNGNLSALTK
jgi:outer membrane protein assembly factor BamB